MARRPHLRFLLRLAHEPIDDRTSLIAVSGDLVGDRARQLLELAANAARSGARRVIVDMRETTFLDSAGTAALLGAGRLLQAEYAALALVVPADGPVRRLLEIQGVTGLFALAETRDAAIAALEATA